MNSLSILIPTYNDPCFELVSQLQRQAQALDIPYEILVADDGSDDTAVVEHNRGINLLPNCQYLEQPHNIGRSAIRNFLAQQAHYNWLLFIDGDMLCREPKFLLNYRHSLDNNSEFLIVYGGVNIGPLLSGNLRSLYEHATAPQYTVECRRKAPYHDFHTANFLISRDVMLRHPFDLRFRHYGYEDVLFGKQMEQHHISILHIDNPLTIERFEHNTNFILKTEEGIRTLYEFRDELNGYSRLLNVFQGPLSSLFTPLLSLWHHLFRSLEHRNLCGSCPSLLIFRLYKLGYMAQLISTSLPRQKR